MNLKEGRSILDLEKTRRDTVMNYMPIKLNNGLKHEVKKLEICRELKKEGKNFYCEATFKNGKRADVYVLEDMLAIEIADSESDGSLELKKREYPCSVRIVRV